MTVVKAASCWIKRFSPCVAPKGHVLDLACGTGRHGRLFLDNANKVTFVDRDINGVQDLENRPNVDIRQCDLEDGRDWPFAPNNFDAIIVANYLYRPHLSALAPTLQNGGVLLYETFAQGNEKLGRPKNPDFLLTSHELLDLARLSGLHVVAFEQGRDGDKIVQRLCAVKGGALAQYTL
jgi:SAM-dependent methyltransferase